MRHYRKRCSVEQTEHISYGRSIHMLMVYISSEWVCNNPFIPSASVGGIVRLVYSKVMLFCGFGLGLMTSMNAY